MKKKFTNFPLYGDYREDFEDDDHFILNYRPKIEFIEPAIEDLPGGQEKLKPEPEVTERADDKTIDELRDRTQKLINGLEAVAQLADLTQRRVDARVKNAGGADSGVTGTGVQKQNKDSSSQTAKGLTINLDPKKDAITIAAIKRRFPEKADPTKLTYNDYKKAIDCLNQSAPEVPKVTADDLRKAKEDPLRTDFGGSDNQHGENRAEIASEAADIIEPLDLDEFQKGAVTSLFSLLKPLILKLLKPF